MTASISGSGWTILYRRVGEFHIGRIFLNDANGCVDLIAKTQGEEEAFIRALLEYSRKSLEEDVEGARLVESPFVGIYERTLDEIRSELAKLGSGLVEVYPLWGQEEP